MTAIKTRKKLIEVALPLEAINKASAREKSIRHGHPSTLHLWWARRPLAAARAVIFAQMVDDPSEYVDVLLSDPKLKRKAESVVKARTKVWEEAKATAERAKRGGIESQVPAPGPKPELSEVIAELERERLFRIIEDLVQWENTNNETVLQAARDEIWQSWRRACADNAGHPRAKELFDRNRLPAFHDPFAGGGALPLEAQRLGLEAYASDLNPVAVLINKAMIEIPPKFAGRPPVNPEARKDKELFAREWKGAQGLAEDVRYYGKWMRDEAEKRIGHLYPKVEVTAEMAKGRPDLKPYVGKKLTVIAWLWARTVKSPNPAFAKVDVPLVSTFLLSTKPGKENHVEPVVDQGSYEFVVRSGRARDVDEAKNGTRLTRGSFRCLMSGTPISYEYIDEEANNGRMGERLMAIAAEGKRERVYLSPTSSIESVARAVAPSWKPEAPSRGTWASNAQGRRYGFETFGDYFSRRQLAMLTTLSDLVSEVRELVADHAAKAGVPADDLPLADGGIGTVGYADALACFLGIGVARYSNASSTICAWNPGQKKEDIRFTFSRQAITMAWDYAEGNPFSSSSGNLLDNFQTWLYKALLFLPHSVPAGVTSQADATSQTLSAHKVVSTDPPYYDNIGYADLADFFYVWQRRALRHVFPARIQEVSATAPPSG